MRALHLKTAQLTNPLGMDLRNPQLSWICADGVHQTAYQIIAVSADTVLWDSGKVADRSMQARFPVECTSRQRVEWKVRLWDEKDQEGEWSEPAFFEMGLLNMDDWKAVWIDPEHLADDTSVFPAPEPSDEPMLAPHRPASWLRTAFFAPDPQANARLYITAHGLYEAYLNGHRIGENVLTPGTGNYDFHMPYQVYDLAGMFQEGENELMVQLGDGWYRGCSGTDGERNLFGEDIALLAQVELNKQVVCASDASWEATQDGPLRANDLQMGETYDARIGSPLGANAAETDSWHSVFEMGAPTVPLCCTNEVPIRKKERFAGRLLTTPNGQTVIDFGQNLAGFVTFDLQAHEGQKLVLWHGETLDENGNFTQENFQDRNRHKEGGVDQKVTYICKEGANHYETTFSIWGFRYALVETDIDLSTADAHFAAIAVYSDMEETASFVCGNPDVNQLFSNSLWSMKGNFCDIPTDCPTRERAGWTGDAQLFVDTGLFLMDAPTVYRKWLSEVRLQQQPDGKVMNISPRNNNPSFFTMMLAGSTGWGDASVLVPWAVYRRTGDVQVLEENYNLMKGWYGYLQSRAALDDPRVPMDPDDPYRTYTVTNGIDYGEWCEPGVNSQMAMQASNYPVATAYYAYTGHILSQISAILGREEDAAEYRRISDLARDAFRHIVLPEGRIDSKKQADYVRPLAMGLLTEEEAAQAAADLNALVIECDYHLNTGFLATPHLCRVLADNGYVETAYRLLLQDTCPGWLYEVKKGATTVWENWDGIDEEGHVKASLNHYSYGSIVGWLIDGVCGIHMTHDSIRIAPHPDRSLGYAEAIYHSPKGTIKSAWHYEGETISYTIELPANTTAQICLPDGRTMECGCGRYTF